MFATAADVPPELFDRILGHFTLLVDRAIAPSSEQRAEAKRYLSQCSLTCKFWASRCRPMLFYVISLRCLDDVNTLFGFPAMLRFYITDLLMEVTEPSKPWTHIIHARIRAGEFSPTMRLSHQLNGACTPTSVQTLRSIHPSLPRRTPVLVHDAFPIYIQNYRLKQFVDLIHVVRRLWGFSGWQARFSNVSWIKPPERVPPTLSAKSRAMCGNLNISGSAERWPFILLCFSTREPEPNAQGLLPYVAAGEAFTIASMVRCITAPVGHKGRSACMNTGIYRADVRAMEFNLHIQCNEKLMCTPFVKFGFRGGRLRSVRLAFNADPAAGCVPLDFDWKEFDSYAAQCRSLIAVTIIVEEDEQYVANLYTAISDQMKYTHEAGRLKVQYWPEYSKTLRTWVPEPANMEDGTPQ